MPSEDAHTPPHEECLEPQLWSAPDSSSSEVEVSELLESLVRAVKPRLLVETGTFTGASTERLARAIQANGRGHIYGIELDPQVARQARSRLADAGLDDVATVVNSSSLSWEAPEPIDMAFLDAGAGWHRFREFLHLREWMHPRTIVCVHDTSRHLRLPRLSFEALAAQGVLSPVWIPSPRGLLIAQPRWPNLIRKGVGLPRTAAYRGYTGARATAAQIRDAARRQLSRSSSSERRN